MLSAFGSKSFASAGQLLLLGLTLLTAPSQAAKPGGATLPTGIIYHIGPIPGATQHGTAVMTALDASNGNKTVLGLGLFGVPSYTKPGGHRWFVSTALVANQFYPDGTPKRAVVARRDDYHYADNNTPTTNVRLTYEDTLELWGADWVAGDAQISVIGRRWSSTEPGAIIVDGGIYTAPPAFDAEGNVIGLAAPLTLAIPLPLVEPLSEEPRMGPEPDVAFYSWNPAGNNIAYSNRADLELWVADLLGGRTRILDKSPHMPKWSPDGTKIAFTHNGIWTVKINGTAAKEIIRTTSSWHYHHAHWSPDGAFLVFSGQSLAAGTQNLFRVTSTGSGLTQVTFSPAPLQDQATEYNAGWR